MSQFSYQARDAQGELIRGVLQASSLQDASRQLREQGKFIVELTEARADAKARRTSRSRSGVRASTSGGAGGGRIKRRDVIFFAHQMSVMVETGVPMSEALICASDQVENQALRAVLSDITSSVQAGEDFSKALGRHPKVFPTVMRSLIRAGELSGAMPTLLERAAVYMTKEQQTIRRLKGALTYPAIMLTLAVTITVFLLIFVLPRFSSIYDSRAATLPAPTRLLMSASASLTDGWMYWAGGLAALAIAWMILRSQEAGRLAIDRAKLRAPVVAPLYRQAYLTRSCRTLGTMITAGVSMLDTVATVKAVVDNREFARLWDRVDDDLRHGSQLSDALFESELIPNNVCQMIRSGEKSGRLGQVLERVGDFTEAEFDQTVDQATQLIEPIMIVTMGSLVGFVAISLLLPIFSAGRVASGG